MKAFRYIKLTGSDLVSLGDWASEDDWDPNDNTDLEKIKEFNSRYCRLPKFEPAWGIRNKKAKDLIKNTAWRIEYDGALVQTSEPENDHRKIEMEL